MGRGSTPPSLYKSLQWTGPFHPVRLTFPDNRKWPFFFSPFHGPVIRGRFAKTGNGRPMRGPLVSFTVLSSLSLLGRTLLFFVRATGAWCSLVHFTLSSSLTPTWLSSHGVILVCVRRKTPLFPSPPPVFFVDLKKPSFIAVSRPARCWLSKKTSCPSPLGRCPDRTLSS